jgi:hypothetical protein
LHTGRQSLDLSAKLTDHPSQEMRRLILISAKVAVVITPARSTERRVITELFHIFDDKRVQNSFSGSWYSV